ncbi:MAG: flavodoxin-dependent (E)-4-hydroxy-3-methylbut-2-enyl-diphosphate synthase [Spirochaetes bacterium]|nr:flavodoxin-dependent (E)-4-hydroxy-3-methylbut-2-enyl-diphosphate synthase [Spirochaetota bacterium]
MKIKRHKTRKVRIGDLKIGGNEPIAVESMTNADVYSPSKIIKQIKQLEKAGCKLVRISLPDLRSASYISTIKKNTMIPLMGDIHFDYRIALKAIEEGIDSIRLNPGNIRQKDKVRLLVQKVKERKITVRVGSNAGSVDRNRYKKNDADALVKSVMEHIRIFEKAKYYNLIVSLKSSDVMTTVSAYEKFSKIRNYPLHIGITEAGTRFSGTVKSSVGLGLLLARGLGDTIRVSLSCDPVEEIYTGYKILQSLGLYKNMVDIISCPTCGRAGIDVEKIAAIIENRVRGLNRKLKVAVMGCIVNGPGEAREADIGVAGSSKEAILFKKGKMVKKIDPDKVIDELVGYIEKF